MEKYLLDDSLFTLQELEQKLQFQFLPTIAFETPEEEKEVKAKGLAKEKAGEVSAKSLELGEKFLREIESSYLPEVSIRLINDQVGYGLFAEERLKVGAYAGEYTGIVRENNRRYFEPLNPFCYEYPVPDFIGRSYVVDATKGHLTRFINHSYEPNLRPTHVFHDGFYHLIFLVIRPIAKGTQLTYDYGSSYWQIRSKPQTL